MPSNPAPQITVLMAVYNGERYLAGALDSIFNQTFQDFEIVVVDDASTDGTPDILDRFSDPKLIRIENPTNIGQTRSLNVGLAHCRGRYLARHDADDLSHPDRFEKQIGYLNAHPNVGLLGSHYSIIDNAGQVLEDIHVPPSNAELQTNLLDGNVFCHGSVLIDQKFLRAIGGYTEYFQVTQDFDLWLRLAEHCELAALQEVLYQYRFDSETVTRKKRGLQLAYKRLALDLAEHRRTRGGEPALPEDVMSAYPPEPITLFKHARWEAYLYYAAHRKDLGAESLHDALEMQAESHLKSSNSWEGWTQARARQLADLRGDPQAGADFIDWVLGIIHPQRESHTLKKTIAQFYADQTFIAHEAGLRKRTLSNFINTIKHDTQWLTNRGLWSIVSKSLRP